MARARRPEDAGALVRLPHPESSSRTIERASRARRSVPLTAVLATGVVTALGQALGGIGYTLGAMLSGVLFFGVWRRGRTLDVRVDDTNVVVPSRDLVLPRGKGQLVVQAIERKDKGQVVYRWSLEHSEGGVIATDCVHPLVVRACAEGLAMAGQWPLVWRSPVETLEERKPTELDLPLAVREAREPMIPVNRPRPFDALYDVEPLGDQGGVRARFVRGVFGRARTATFGQLLGFGFVMLPISVSLGFWLIPLAFLPALLFSRLATPDVDITRTGITLRYRMFGGITLLERRLPAAEIESLYIDTLPGKRVLAVGDETQVTLAHVRDAFEAEWLRGVIVKALVDEPAPSAVPSAHAVPSDVAAGERAAGVDAACPSCLHAGLERLGGELDEQVCPACGGRFLPEVGAARLVEDELGITRDMLRELTRYFGGERRTCPSCRSRTSAVRLKGVTADLCQGCGGLWLDAGELGRLSAGRYEG